VVHFLAGVDLNERSVARRLEAAQILREQIQATRMIQARRENSFCRLQDIHPPAAGGGRLRKSGRRGADDSSTIPGRRPTPSDERAGRALAFTTTNVAEARGCSWRSLGVRAGGIVHEPDSGVEAAPSVYKQRAYFQAFADATANARKYVLLVTNTQDVLILTWKIKSATTF
jgi:hypothetical protein